MTRPITFRAWTGKEMHHFDFDGIYGDGLDADGGGSAFDWRYRTFPMMQFTGLLDKNGKEMFEGDIIEWIRASPATTRKVTGVIFWDDMKAGFYVVLSHMYPHKGGNLRCDHVNAKNKTVIGNIYENPESHLPQNN